MDHCETTWRSIGLISGKINKFNVNGLNLFKNIFKQAKHDWKKLLRNSFCWQNIFYHALKLKNY